MMTSGACDSHRTQSQHSLVALFRPDLAMPCCSRLDCMQTCQMLCECWLEADAHVIQSFCLFGATYSDCNTVSVASAQLHMPKARTAR